LNVKILTQEQYTPEYWQARCGVPTCSAFSNICTAAKGDYSKSAAGYIAELIAQRYDPDYGMHEDYQSAAMKNGHIIEPEARRFYEFDREAKVEQVGFCITDDARFGGSPDGLVGDDGVLEIKSPTHKTQVEYLLAGTLPDAYKQQCHGHLIVTGRKWVDFLSYCRRLHPLLVRVVPDEYTDRLRECLNRFHEDYQEALSKIDTLGAAIEEHEYQDVVMF